MSWAGLSSPPAARTSLPDRFTPLNGRCTTPHRGNQLLGLLALELKFWAMHEAMHDGGHLRGGQRPEQGSSKRSASLPPRGSAAPALLLRGTLLLPVLLPMLILHPPPPTHSAPAPAPPWTLCPRSPPLLPLPWPRSPSMPPLLAKRTPPPPKPTPCPYCATVLSNPSNMRKHMKSTLACSQEKARREADEARRLANEAQRLQVRCRLCSELVHGKLEHQHLLDCRGPQQLVEPDVDLPPFP